MESLTTGPELENGQGPYPALRVDRIMFGLPPNADTSSHFTAGVTTNGNWRSCAALSLARVAIPSRRRLKSGDGLIAAELSLMVAFQMV
jgi:hypothetical protein